MKENLKIGDKVYLIDDSDDGEILICTDIVTAILIEKNLVSVRCKTSGNEFWVLGENAFLNKNEIKRNECIK